MNLRDRLVKLFSPKGGVWLLSPGLAGREEQEVIRDLEYYGDRFLQVVRRMEDLSRAFGGADADRYRSILREMDLSCREAEDLRLKILQRITDQRLFFPGSRKDMTRLLNRMSGALFQMRGFSILEVPAQPLKDRERFLLTEIALTGTKRAQTLSDALRYINEDPLTALGTIPRERFCQDDLSGSLEALRREGEGPSLAEEDRRSIPFLRQMLWVMHEILESLGEVQGIAIQYL